MEQSQKDLYSLSVNKISEDLIDGIIGENPDSFSLIIVDSYSAKILSNYTTMTDILNKGIFTVESIYKPRQKFIKYHAIYFISPTKKTVDLLKKDFEKKILYNKIHIFFTHRCPEEILNNLISKEIINRCLTCKEFNLSFLTTSENVFELGFESGLKIFKCSNEIKLNLIQSIADRLSTVCATLNIYPYIQYQNNSELCVELKNKLEPILKQLSQIKNYPRKGILLLTDRSFDAVTPLLHDYSYESLIYDLLKVSQEKFVEVDGKKYKLSNKDDLWRKYSKMHIAEVFENLSKDFDDFQKSDLSKIRDYDNLDSFEDMHNALSNMNTYKLKSNQLSMHIKIAEEINKLYKENKIYDIIELEQDIVTGENEKGKILNRDIFKNFTLLKSIIENQREDVLRILLILFCSMSISEKDFNVLCGKLNQNEESIFRNFSVLGIEKNTENKTERREGINLKRDKINSNNSINKKMKYSTLRGAGQFELLVEKASNFELNLKDFPINEFNGELPKINKKFGMKNFFGNKKEDEEEKENFGNLIFFNIGGLSINEICAIGKLEKNGLLNHNLFIGSTNILTAKNYMEQLEKIDNDYSKEIGNDTLNNEMSGSIGLNESNSNSDSSKKEIFLDIIDQ